MDYKFIGVFVSGGILSHIERYTSLEEGKERMKAEYKENPFEPETDDARIYNLDDAKEVYSFNHEESEE